MDQLIVLQDVSLRCIELIQKLIFEVSEFHAELALQLDDIVPLLIDLWSLLLQ